jgi:hypothetical protein
MLTMVVINNFSLDSCKYQLLSLDLLHQYYKYFSVAYCLLNLFGDAVN